MAMQEVPRTEVRRWAVAVKIVKSGETVPLRCWIEAPDADAALAAWDRLGFTFVTGVCEIIMAPMLEAKAAKR
jgi:hypothetical protein